MLKWYEGEMDEDVMPGVPDEQQLDEELEQSFPASDPPSHWAGPDLGPVATTRH